MFLMFLMIMVIRQVREPVPNLRSRLKLRLSSLLFLALTPQFYSLTPLLQRGLDRAVSGAVGFGADRSHRRIVQDRAAAHLAHLRNRMLDAQENAAQPDRKTTVPGFDRGRLQRTYGLKRRFVVEHDIEAAE